jgi:chaperone modulatory protein CbpM
MIRIRQEMDLNIEGIDVVFNLLQKVETMQNELTQWQNKLRFYEE